MYHVRGFVFLYMEQRVELPGVSLASKFTRHVVSNRSHLGLPVVHLKDSLQLLGYFVLF